MLINKKIPLVFGVPRSSFFKNFKAKKVFVSELRPGLEGIKVVAKEFIKRGIKPIVICDNMLAFCMKRGLVKDVHIFCNAHNRKFALCRAGSLIAALTAKIHGIAAYLYKGAALNLKPEPLLEIEGFKVTVSGIKTYVPVIEEVPLSIVRERIKNG